MAVYSLRYRYIFFANPQTASKAISRTLESELEGRVLHKEIGADRRAGLERLHHITYEQVVEQGLLAPGELDGLVRVTGVRNPYDLLVSRYLKHRERFTNGAERYRWVRREGKTGVQASMAAAATLGFPEWLDAQYGHRKRARGIDRYLDHADMVIRFEAIQADFDAVLHRIGIGWPITVARENVTVERQAGDAEPVKRRYADFYDDASRALVTRVFEPVIQRFDYRFEA